MGGAASKAAVSNGAEGAAPAIGESDTKFKAVLKFKALARKSGGGGRAQKADDETRPAASPVGGLRASLQGRSKKLSLVLTAAASPGGAHAAALSRGGTAKLLKAEPGDDPADLEALRRLEARPDARGGWLKSRLLCHTNLLVAAVYADETRHRTGEERDALRTKRFAGFRKAAEAARARYAALSERIRRGTVHTNTGMNANARYHARSVSSIEPARAAAYRSSRQMSPSRFKDESRSDDEDDEATD